MCSTDYYGETDDSFVDQITLTPTDYLTEQIQYYENGLPVTITGIFSEDWELGSGTAHYVIKGASVYISTSTGKVVKIEGYPSALDTTVTLTKTSSGGKYIYTSTTKLGVNKALILIKSSASIVSQFYGVVETNTSD